MPPIKTATKMTAKQIWYPTGVTPKDELNNEKDVPIKSTVRYPNQDFASKFYAVCHKAKVSMNEILVAAAEEFTNKNAFLLEKTSK